MTDRSAGFRALGTLLAVLLFMPVLAAPVAADALELSADRYGTAARAAVDAYPEGADAVVVASGEVFADALAAAPLAAAFDAPILLTARDAVPEAPGQALEQLGA